MSRIYKKICLVIFLNKKIVFVTVYNNIATNIMSNFRSAQPSGGSSGSSFAPSFTQSNGTVPQGPTNNFAPWVHVLFEFLKPSTLHAPGVPQDNSSPPPAPQPSESNKFVPREFR